MQPYTAHKIKFSIEDFFSKCDQIRRKLQIWSHFLKKLLIENFTFYAIIYTMKLLNETNSVFITIQFFLPFLLKRIIFIVIFGVATCCTVFEVNKYKRQFADFIQIISSLFNYIRVKLYN